MKKVILSLSFIGMAFLASCGGSAETVEANDAQEVATASENAQAYAINADESSISWRGFKIFQDPTKPETGHHGFIKFKSGELTFNEGVLEAGSFIADLTTLESVDLNDDPDSKADLDGHLKSEDFLDRKSTRLNSSHVAISYAVFCLKKKNKNKNTKYR